MSSKENAENILEDVVKKLNVKFHHLEDDKHTIYVDILNDSFQFKAGHNSPAIWKLDAVFEEKVYPYIEQLTIF